MRPKWMYLLLMIALLIANPSTGKSDVSLGVSISDEGVKGFYLAVGDFYDVPQEHVLKVKSRKIPDEDLPVVFFLAERAKVDPAVIIKLRLGGKSWMEISLHYGISAEAYYIPVKNPQGPPYGKAYGHYKKRNKSDWKTIRLNDEEIVGFVNLKFLSEHYGYPPEQVMKHRGAGKTFVGISTQIEKSRTISKAPAGEKQKNSGSKSPSKGKSKGKGKP